MLSWFSGKGVEAMRHHGVDRELAFHVEELTAANIEAGMEPVEARRQALLSFGGEEQVRQQVREVHSSALREALRFHLRAALRFLRQAPSFACAVVGTLALAIGANSAVFSALEAIVLHGLPFTHSEQLVRLHQYDRKLGQHESLVAATRVEDWNGLNRTFQAISGYYTGDATLSSGDMPEKITVAFVSPRFLELWEVAPLLGRNFTPAEQLFGGPCAAIASFRLWETRLQADPHALGRPLHLGRSTCTLAAVMPASFSFPDRDVDLWEPSPVNAPYAQARNSSWFTVFGRLKGGVSLAAGQTDLNHVQALLGRQYPASDSSLQVGLEPLKATIVSHVTGSLWLIYGAVSLLLLIACTNIAALLTARMTQRQSEIGIRFALGASRSTIVLQLLAEVLLLVTAGAVLGLLLASQASRLLHLLTPDLPRLAEVGLNWRLVAYTTGCTVVVTLLCGLLPALRATRFTLAQSLQAARTQVAVRASWQWTLVGIQVALAVALLVVSGLLLRSFALLGSVQPGFDPTHVLTLRISAGWGETADMGKLAQRVNRDLEGLRAIPGVEAAATSASIPGNATETPTEFRIAEGRRDPMQHLLADVRFVSSGYFATLSIPVLQGSACPDTSAQPTLLVNRSFAERYLQGAPALGYHLQSLPETSYNQPGDIRGIVGDAREDSSDVPPVPTVYWCISAPTPDPNFLVRTHGNPAAMAEAVRRTVHRLEPERSVFGVMPLVDHLDDRFAEQRLRTVLLTAFALTAISLVCLGLYGTVSYLGRTRRREVGLRLALGALPRQIVRRFVQQGVHVALLGGLLGLLLGAGISRLFQSMLYGISALDPLTYAAVALLTLVVTTLAALVPAVRASRVNPTEALREE